MHKKLQRYFWLIDTLKNCPMTLNQLSKKWDNSLVNDSNMTLSRRTFQEHKNTINNLGIGIEIVRKFH